MLKKTVKDIVFEINFFSSKWNESGQSIEINAELRLIYKTYGKLPVDNVVASMSYQPENGYWYDISTESRLLETRNILEKRFQETAMDLVHRFEIIIIRLYNISSLKGLKSMMYILIL